MYKKVKNGKKKLFSFSKFDFSGKYGEGFLAAR